MFVFLLLFYFLCFFLCFSYVCQRFLFFFIVPLFAVFSMFPREVIVFQFQITVCCCLFPFSIFWIFYLFFKILHLTIVLESFLRKYTSDYFPLISHDFAWISQGFIWILFFLSKSKCKDHIRTNTLVQDHPCTVVLLECQVPKLLNH